MLGSPAFRGRSRDSPSPSRLQAPCRPPAFPRSTTPGPGSPGPSEGSGTRVARPRSRPGFVDVIGSAHRRADPRPGLRQFTLGRVPIPSACARSRDPSPRSPVGEPRGEPFQAAEAAPKPAVLCRWRPPRPRPDGPWTLDADGGPGKEKPRHGAGQFGEAPGPGAPGNGGEPGGSLGAGHLRPAPPARHVPSELRGPSSVLLPGDHGAQGDGSVPPQGAPGRCAVQQNLPHCDVAVSHSTDPASAGRNGSCSAWVIGGPDHSRPMGNGTTPPTPSAVPAAERQLPPALARTPAAAARGIRISDAENQDCGG
jgi:hypothetical protein